MAQFGASIQTAQITTGNFQTTVDLYQASSFSSYPESNGQQNPLGAAYYDATGTTANVWGVPGKFRYVRYLSTANPALTGVTGPFIVYWTDATFTTVTPVSSESLTGGLNLVAGLAMPNLTAIPGLVNAGATGTQTNLGGNYIWVCVGGYVSGVYVAGATPTAGQNLIGSATNFTPTASSTAANSRILGYATTGTTTNLCNVLVTLES